MVLISECVQLHVNRNGKSKEIRLEIRTKSQSCKFRWKMILENEIRTSNNATDKPNGNNNQNNSNQGREQNENGSSSEQLRRWAVNYNVSKRAVSDLLKILIGFGLVWLPKDSRTLLSTPRYVEMRNLSNGKIW